MATTKTIQPTGATITIPDFTEKPDIRVITTDVSNITDAANALSVPRSISMTSESIISSVDMYNRCIECGKVVMLSFSAVITATNGWKKAFTFSENVGPNTDVYFPLINATSRTIAGYAYISRTDVFVDVSASGEKLRGSCTFIKGV